MEIQGFLEVQEILKGKRESSNPMEILESLMGVQDQECFHEILGILMHNHPLEGAKDPLQAVKCLVLIS